MDLPVALSLAWVRPRRTAVIPAPGLVPAAASTPQGVTEPVVRRAERRFGPALGGIAIAALLVFALVWFARRPFASTPKPHRGVTAASPAAATVTGGALGADGVARARQEQATRDSIARAASAYVPTDSFPATEVTNPGDSANASAFAVKLEEVFTPAGAILNLQQKYKSVPAGTYNRDPRSRFLIEVAGAYPTKAGADSLLQQLTARGLLGLGVGTVVSVPYAFMVKQDVPLSEAAARVTHYVTGPGKPVYALRQANGTATLYFGAYASPQQAALAIPDVKGLGIKPTLVYRTGRVF
jgi:hypothetical protein